MIGQVTMPRITVVGQDNINYSRTVRNIKAVSIKPSEWLRALSCETPDDIRNLV